MIIRTEDASKNQEIIEDLMLAVALNIKSGEYFIDARQWYIRKYVAPIVYRSIALLTFLGFLMLFLCIILDLNSLMPVVKQVQYSIQTKGSYHNRAKIIRADTVKGNPLGSIADIMLQNYVISREQYDYDKLKSQIKFMQNNSSKVVFRKYNNFISIDNPLSPVMRYQKYIRRSIKILSTKYNSTHDAVVVFESIAKNIGGEIIEDMIWEAGINFEMDEINLKTPHGTKFNFSVTNYNLKLISDKQKGK
jgi:type IV secretion system protein VirB8